MVARRFHDNEVTERMLTHDLEAVHFFSGLSNPDIIEVKYPSKVASVINGEEVLGLPS